MQILKTESKNELYVCMCVRERCAWLNIFRTSGFLLDLCMVSCESRLEFFKWYLSYGAQYFLRSRIYLVVVQCYLGRKTNYR